MMETIGVQIKKVMTDIMSESAGIEGALVVDSNGFVVSAIGAAIREGAQDLIGGIITSLANMASKTGKELGTGEIESVIIEGKERNILITTVAHRDSLVVLASKETPLGILFLAARKGAQKLQGLLMQNQTKE